MAEWPQRGQKAPNYWDAMLRSYVDEADRLTVVDGGTITLDDTLPQGSVRGYRLTAPTQVNGSAMSVGVHVFERTATGWKHRVVPEGTDLAPVDPGEGPVEVVPQEPVWDDSLVGFTIPSITGVKYVDDDSGVQYNPGFAQASPDSTVSITSFPVSDAYVFPSGVATSWSHTFASASTWVTAFSDTLKTPAGEFTDRNGWAISKTGTDPSFDHAVIDATGLYLTGGLEMTADTPVAAVQHFVETKYDFREGMDAPNEPMLTIRVSVAWGNHQIILNRASGKGALSWSGTTGWPDMAARNGADVNNLPLFGTIRVENDGTYITVYIDGSVVASGLRNPDNNPSWAGAPVGYSLRLRAVPNNNPKCRYTDAVLGTRS